MMGNSSRPSYETIPNYPPSSFQAPQQHSVYQPQSTSIAMFHIPTDATNSLYIDGIPNDASEREVSRTVFFS